MNNHLKRILQAATQAPSGENAQPWRFILRSDAIELHNVPDRDQSLYNWKQRASYMANGASLENLLIAARHFGYDPRVDLFPDANNKDHVATIWLASGGSPEQEQDLYSYIEKRATNRKPYDTQPLSAEELNELKTAARSSDVSSHFTMDPAHKDALGMVGGTNERVMLSNQFLHQFFFSHLNWSKEEDARNKVGFYIETLELPLPAKVMFRMLKYWKVMNAFNKIKFHEVIGKQNGYANAKAGAFGVLTIPNLEPRYFVETGRVLERIWLTATKLGLSMQPLTGVLFFMLQIRAGEIYAFSSMQVETIKSAYNDITRIFNLKDKNLAVFMFRIGRGDRPTARASKFAIEHVVIRP